ncbi:hypothetical protein FNV62_48770 [Streptomyces sp. RLB3-17]|uniref:Uncharacterized protein n=1 Tax=Streptomyces mirabilis TaxID=68239 RepID=A0ABU3UCS8_9ACTN|nr:MULTISPECIES: hypothetical protein [Streptomyces]MCX4614602.1 hypothetical protein [Streptomyces mirabilis]MCX5354714.1 hypothetical protein [Streptomyces mirabilis]MDU8991714.1 hypothetical protein [Streptomyces mirabilis]NMI55240.1 hypothetical protein [Streptomyces sp. RLA2-12]QDN62285.1 hypothetical protein FNV67_49855 [Streptomyces sp. S1D4-20]
MGFAVFMTLPGLVILLTLAAFADQLLPRAGQAGLPPWRNGVCQGQISATGFEQLIDPVGGTAVVRRPRS